MIVLLHARQMLFNLEDQGQCRLIEKHLIGPAEKAMKQTFFPPSLLKIEIQRHMAEREREIISLMSFLVRTLIPFMW